VTVDLGFDNLDLSAIKALCDKLNVEYHIVKTDIAQIIFEERKEKNPCSLCAKMRKGALNEAMKNLGISKIAYAHHRDDVVETMLLSLMYEGRFHCFAPLTYLDRMEVTVIRPLIYVHEADVIGFVKRYDVPVVKSPCPADGNTKREYAHNLLKDMIKDNPGVKNRMFTAITESNIKGWEKNEGAHY
jgi:tRNA(Ile)-lysidine synthase TilS/MesJ